MRLTEQQRRPHIIRMKSLRRSDRYGQCHKVRCHCGLESGWHTTPERARTSLLQNHGVSA